ncbi:MAG: invasion associated locus B family protein [Acetobacteraceae bacterium]|nr:invasion associated locus B family protein [Acetobacteraceae bacterium]
MRPILLLALLLPSLAAAQPAPQRPPAPHAAEAPRPAPAPEPERTTATFGDWTLRCESRPEGQPGRQCEIVQVLQDQRAQPVAQFAVGRAQAGAPLRLVALLPVNVSFGPAFRLVPEDGQAPLDVALRACGPRGCLADAELDAAALSRLRTRDGQGRFEMRDAAGQDVALPLSFRGFGQALAALERG